MMSTPSTSQVRSWAQSKGMDVGDRGRLSAELHEAYRQANGGKATAVAAPAKKAAAKKAPATKPAAKKAPAPRRAQSSPPKTVGRPLTAKAPAKAAPARDSDLAARVARVESDLAALTSRLDGLTPKAAKPAKPAAPAKSARPAKLVKPSGASATRRAPARRTK